jgi:hypothetical protein
MDFHKIILLEFIVVENDLSGDYLVKWKTTFPTIAFLGIGPSFELLILEGFKPVTVY